MLEQAELGLIPSLSLLACLGSIVVHIEEYWATGNRFDKTAIESCLQHSELKEWLEKMDARSLIPRKR
jgi:hypothetical protein